MDDLDDLDDLEFITLLTRNPCPSWCELESGHAYDEETEGGNIDVTTHLSRCHEISVGKATSSAFMGNDVPRKQFNFDVKILVKEHAKPDETGVWQEPPTVFAGGEVCEMSLGETEELIAILARAAEMSRAIEAGRDPLASV